ncbi:MAG: beta-ketoacyl-ACP synthase III [Campylobacteraceae bacterium]|jgi:3-oxoacyl-[acyl-carrier-protein] synthase-3|nr:beta-ketoacyl-ACP synthase III [Campylobacteraceae bacterium]
MNDVFINYLSAVMPNEPVDNEEMEEVLGFVGGMRSRARKIVLKSNGIKNRYYVFKDGELLFTNAKLAALAVEELKTKGAPLESLELLACGTSLPDQTMPNHALMVHGELKAKPMEAVSTAGICASGIMALKYAYMSVSLGLTQNAAAVGSETASQLLRKENFEAESLFKLAKLEENPEIAFEKDFLRWMLSDGAGALWLSSKPNQNTVSLKINWIEQISYAGQMPVCMYAGAHIDEEGRFRGYLTYSQEERQKLSVFAVKQDVRLLNENIVEYAVEKPLKEIIKKRELNAEDIDYFLPHYSSHYFRDKTYEGLKKAGFEIGYEKWFTNLYEKGNTGAASFYIILEEFVRIKPLKNGDKILCFIPESSRFSTAFVLLEAVVKQ